MIRIYHISYIYIFYHHYIFYHSSVLTTNALVPSKSSKSSSPSTPFCSIGYLGSNRLTKSGCKIGGQEISMPNQQGHAFSVASAAACRTNWEEKSLDAFLETNVDSLET